MQDWLNCRVLVTGHTGFKGTWLTEWLLLAGAKVSGLSLAPDRSNVNFELLEHEARLEKHYVCDLLDKNYLNFCIAESQPDVVFHLAAQALVRRGYREPLLTWETNVLGTLNVLEAVRIANNPTTVIVVTTDKVYQDRGHGLPFKENDPLGGYDPYSASKASCELAVVSWRNSFAPNMSIRVATARAGNVIGAGDFNEDRIVPDCYKMWKQGIPVSLRNPNATRPWQHVLEPLSGYLDLAQYVRSGANQVFTAYNFGPGRSGECSVADLVALLAQYDGDRVWETAFGDKLYETQNLTLCNDLAKQILGWEPILALEEAALWTDRGYSVPHSLLPSLIRDQIQQYRNLRSKHRIEEFNR